jgi:murein DD-endopeptidase MepM/ murein hydrolase activator NlpD
MRPVNVGNKAAIGRALISASCAVLLSSKFVLAGVAKDNCDEPLRTIPALDFHPVVILPANLTQILDLTKPPVKPGPVWSVGKYNEDRVIYDQPLFGGKRSIHIGIDLGGPAHTAVHAFWEGEVVENGVNPAKGDYGPVLVTKHALGETTVLYALFGHLSKASLDLSPKGRRFSKGEVVGWIGTEDENGGWPPHVHFQLSWERPPTHDMPGAVSKEDRESALKQYPDPQVVLGKLY